MVNITDLLKGVQKNISLSKYTTFKIGGAAKYFCVAENIDEIKEALEFAGKNNLEIFMLGGGSNVLVSDKGFDGLVIRITNNKLRITNNEVFVGSGLSLAKLVSESVKAKLAGFEWAAGIPGTVGGAVHNNAGANGKSMADVVEEVEVLEITSQPPPFGSRSGQALSEGLSSSHDNGRLGGVRKLINKQCNFSYRNSIFKEEKNYIILNVVLKLEKGNKKEIKEKISNNLKDRLSRQPIGHPSVGSVFKNPKVNKKLYKKILSEYPELKGIAKNDVIPVWWLVDVLGLRGKKIGGIMVSEKHSNFIINTDNGKAEDVVILMSLIKQKVRNHFGIQLKEEIEYMGF